MIIALKKPPQQKLVGNLKNMAVPPGFNPSVKNFQEINYQLEFNYFSQEDLLLIKGEIDFTLVAIDAGDGHSFVHQGTIAIDEEYTFQTTSISSELNLLLSPDLDLNHYLIEQIGLQIPIALNENHDIISRNGFGWEVLSESTYQDQLNNEVVSDSRWDKLDKFKINK